MKKIKSTLENYNEGPIIVGNRETEIDKKYERAKRLLADVADLGMSQKAAARELGVSLSTIRRASRTVESYEGLRSNNEPDDDARG